MTICYPGQFNPHFPHLSSKVLTACKEQWREQRKKGAPPTAQLLQLARPIVSPPLAPAAPFRSLSLLPLCRASALLIRKVLSEAVTTPSHRMVDVEVVAACLHWLTTALHCWVSVAGGTAGGAAASAGAGSSASPASTELSRQEREQVRVLVFVVYLEG